MQAVVGDHPLDTAAADGEVSLAQLLGDDLGGGVGVQKAVAQDLADGWVSAAIIRFGAGLLRLEGSEAAALKGGEHLVIALTAIPVFVREVRDVGGQTLAFDDHEEAAGQFVGGCNAEGAGWAGQLVSLQVELESHIHGGRIGAGGGYVYLNMAL